MCRRKEEIKVRGKSGKLAKTCTVILKLLNVHYILLCNSYFVIKKLDNGCQEGDNNN